VGWPCRELIVSHLPCQIKSLPLATIGSVGSFRVSLNVKQTANSEPTHSKRFVLGVYFQTCDSSDAVLNVFREKIPGFDQSRSTDSRFIKWLDPTVNVLYKFSGFLGGGISLGSLREFEANSFRI